MQFLSRHNTDGHAICMRFSILRLPSYSLGVETSQVFEIVEFPPEALPAGWTVDDGVSVEGTSSIKSGTISDGSAAHSKAHAGTDPRCGSVIEVGAETQVVVVDDVVGRVVCCVGENGGSMGQLTRRRKPSSRAIIVKRGCRLEIFSLTLF